MKEREKRKQQGDEEGRGSPQTMHNNKTSDARSSFVDFGTTKSSVLVKGQALGEVGLDLGEVVLQGLLLEGDEVAPHVRAELSRPASSK